MSEEKTVAESSEATPTPSPEPSSESPQEQEQKFHCPKCRSELKEVETPTGITYRCPKCGRMVRPLEKGGGEGQEAEEEPEEEEEETTIPPLAVEARKFVVKQLLTRLDTVYGITRKKVGPIASTVEDNPQIALDPTALYWHIKQLAGQANDYQLYLFISGVFNKLREKGLLQQPTPMPVMGMPTQQQTQQPYPFMFPQQQPTQQSFGNPFTPFQQPTPRLPQTTEEFEDFSERKSRARRNEERAEEEHELRMAKIRKEIDIMSQPSKTESSNVVTIVEPIRDGEGKLVKDDKGNIVLRKITGPSDQIRQTSGEDPETRVLNKFERYKNLFKSDLDETKLRTIIKEEQPKKEVEPLTEETVKEAAKEAALNVVAITKQEDKEERRHTELLHAIERGHGSEVVKGYKSDTYRFMGQGMEKIAEVAEHKEPIKIIVQGAKDIMQAGPPEKTVEPEAKEGIFKRVKKEYVAEE